MIIRVGANHVLQWGARKVTCALGWGGVRADKREGDGATPAGRYALRGVMYRADRVPRPLTGLPVTPIRPSDGWCDDPADRRYNTRIHRPFRFRNEVLWRDDSLYDILVVVGHNDAPPVSGRGSAIFIHLARPGFVPTEGCVALAPRELRALLTACDDRTTIQVTEAGGRSPNMPVPTRTSVAPKAIAIG